MKLKLIAVIFLLTIYFVPNDASQIGVISSQSKKLEMQIDSTAYVLDIDEWGIVEGKVSDDVALYNKIQINKALKVAFYKGYKIFKVDLDAYFLVDADNYNRATEQSILLQSNMHFKMSAQTVLRVQPNYAISYAVLSAWKKENVKVSGGKIIGDRYTHDYKKIKSTHEFGYAIYFRGVENGVVDNVELRECTGDGFIVQSTKRRNDDGSERLGEVYSKNITLQNCILDKNRRNNISLTDVDGMLIENNIISNGGDGGKWTKSEGYNSKGVLPRYNIDLEAINYLNDKGELRYTEIVKNVIIRNNTFSGANNGDIDLYKCWNVEIHNNTFDGAIANVASFDIQIYDNVFSNTSAIGNRKYAISIGEKIRPTGIDFNRNYHIYNNKIDGYKNGIRFGSTDGKIYNNKILNCDTGIMLLNGSNNQFYDNVISSSKKSSRGYYNFPGGVKANAITLKNETINVSGYALLFTKLKGTLSIENSTFTGANGMEFRNSKTITLNKVKTSKVINKNSTVVRN